MIKFVLDADGIIKLAKASVLESLTRFAKCTITKQVYKEVSKGKEKMYEDAFIIEGLVKKGKMKISPVNYENIDGLASGECSTLALFHKLKADSIISDDRKFLSLLNSREIHFIIPTDIITLLSTKHHISVIEAISALEKIRSFVHEENYTSAKRRIGGT